MLDYTIVLVIGLTAGVLSGFFGVGGGVLIVPALIMLLALPMHEAVGTSLGALLPPVGLLGAYEYYKVGKINIGFAALIALGLFLGGYIGGKVAIGTAPALVRHAFAVFLVIVAVRLFFK
jgi:uncharacterized membrane protein YfcA